MRTRLWLSSLVLVACGGRGGGGGPDDERDVRGNYALTYDDQVVLKLNLGGAVREVTLKGYGGIADFGVVNGQPATLDLTAFCAKPEVKCPSESFWAKVAIDQPNLKANNAPLQVLQVINDTEHVLDAGVRAASLGGLVDFAQDDKFLLGLGAGGAANPICVALALSLAGGRFTREGETFVMKTYFRTPTGQACTPGDGGVDAGAAASDGGMDGGVVACNPVQVKERVLPPGAKVDGIADGKVFIGWAGGCGFGPFLAGATLTMETGFTGKRTGAFDPPPFTPAPVVLPDGGIPDGGAVDGGALDGG